MTTYTPLSPSFPTMRRVRKCVQRAAYAPACILLISPIYLALAWDLDTRDFFPPMWDSGGKQFLNAGGLPLGEPMNIIISGRSHPDVLSDFGIQWYARSLGFSQECLGFHGGKPFTANLGDGNGWKEVLCELRQNYGNDLLGSCLETFIGGNHFRVARQNGPEANTSALFIAASLEEDLTAEHTVSPNGYNLAREIIVARATNTTTTYGGVVYKAISRDIIGLLDEGYVDNHEIYMDAVVSVLLVDIIEGVEILEGTRGPELLNDE